MVTFDFEMMSPNVEDYTEAKTDGAYVYGLFIDSARWDVERKVLADSEPKVLFSKAPVMYFSPCHKDKVTVWDHYDCPVYKTSERRGMLSTTGHSTNFVMFLRIPSDRPERIWIEMGVAMLTQLGD